MLVSIVAVNRRRLAAAAIRLSGLSSLHRVTPTAVHVDRQLLRLKDAVGETLCAIDVDSLVRLRHVEPLLFTEALLSHGAFLLIRKVRSHLEVGAYLCQKVIPSDRTDSH